MRRPFGRIMNDPTSALPLEELLSLEREGREPAGWSLDEAALIDRCLSGDDTAYDQIVQRYGDMVFNLAYRFLGRHDEAIDLSQEVFLQIYRKLASFRRDASLRTWIYRIVINRAKNRQRWWKRRFAEMTAVHLDELEERSNWELAAPVNGNGVSPHKALLRKEIGHLLRQAIDRLPFDQRSILLLKEIEGLSYDEIAETLELPLGTVKSRLARARRSLRDRLDPEIVGFTEDV
jgi:RNA polymerase sigma-70 factor (ECF subfamily)